MFGPIQRSSAVSQESLNQNNLLVLCHYLLFSFLFMQFSLRISLHCNTMNCNIHSSRKKAVWRNTDLSLVDRYYSQTPYIALCFPWYVRVAVYKFTRVYNASCTILNVQYIIFSFLSILYPAFVNPYLSSHL